MLTAMALPTLAEANVPAWVKLTASEPTTPTKDPPVMLAKVLPL